MTSATLGFLCNFDVYNKHESGKMRVVANYLKYWNGLELLKINISLFMDSSYFATCKTPSVKVVGRLRGTR